MRKKVGIIKRLFCLLLIFLLSINSFAAIVSDNDGSAFITKSEFDALKSSFQSQIDSYNTSIDSKIDGAIASYLAGIKLKAEQESNLMLWGGNTLGLVEDYRSHAYVEGKTGGQIVVTSWVCSKTQWLNGTTSQSGSSQNPPGDIEGYVAFCNHVMNCTPTAFKYLVASYGKIGSTMMWDLQGYASATESLNALVAYTTQADYTNVGCYTIGFCSGWTQTYGTAGAPLSDSTSSSRLLQLCECPVEERDGSYARGGSATSLHNVFNIQYRECDFTSTYVYDATKKYLTNNAASTTYTDVWPEVWYGTNSSAGHDSHSTSVRDLYDAGWRLDESTSAGKKNFHLKSHESHGQGFYGCDNRAYMRKWISSAPSTSQKAIGYTQYSTTSGNHKNWGTVDKDRINVFKSTTGTNCTSSNLYSSEIGAVINAKLSAKCSTATINGQTKTVAPLYIGLPLGEVKENDKVKITLDFLDSTSYEVGFYIDGFPSGTLSSSSAANAGCKIEGTSSHIQSVTGPVTSKTIIVDITKTGILFLKFGATTTSTKGTIKLPNSFTIVREN